ncbi:hypothetical protein ABVN80_01675 [Acinetobacter baumannii]
MSRKSLVWQTSIHSTVARYPVVCFTHPQVASIGLTENAAKAKNLPIRIGKFSLTANGKAFSNWRCVRFR